MAARLGVSRRAQHMEQMSRELHPADYYPTLGEVFVIFLTVAALVGLGYALKRKWTRGNDAVPLPFSLLLWFGAFVLYLLMAGALYNNAADLHKFAVLVWCLLFWIVPMLYFSVTVVNSLAVRTVDRIGPFSAHIEDPSEFAAARKLALRGDINAAVMMYRSYTDNQHNALFEAARLLKSEDRYVDAALLFEEIAERFKHINRVWAEATFHLAKIKELYLKEPQAAKVLLRDIIKQAPDTRFCQLARADLARLQVMHEDFIEELAKVEAPPVERDPFFVPKHIDKPEDMAVPVVPEVPAQDPFFKPRAVKAGKTPQASVPDRGVKPSRTGKSAAPQTAATKKVTARKAPAKKKPAAKKKPSRG